MKLTFNCVVSVSSYYRQEAKEIVVLNVRVSHKPLLLKQPTTVPPLRVQIVDLAWATKRLRNEFMRDAALTRLLSNMWHGNSERLLSIDT